jgi:two-component system OmpR family response regulator
VQWVDQNLPYPSGWAAMRILVIEDDRETAGFLVDGLKEEGHNVSCVHNGREGFVVAVSEEFELAIIDRMLPAMDGLTIVKALRAANIETPVLFLTTMSGVDDRVTGLNAGGDDYLVKPFAFGELVARVAALGRRPRKTLAETHFKVADLELDLLTRTVRRAGREVTLQPREFNLLEYLMRNAGHVVTRTMLLENVWDYHFDPRTNIVESHLSRLRTKVDKGFKLELIHTVRGAGYCLRA